MDIKKKDRASKIMKAKGATKKQVNKALKGLKPKKRFL